MIPVDIETRTALLAKYDQRTERQKFNDEAQRYHCEHSPGKRALLPQELRRLWLAYLRARDVGEA